MYVTKDHIVKHAYCFKGSSIFSAFLQQYGEYTRGGSCMYTLIVLVFQLFCQNNHSILCNTYFQSIKIIMYVMLMGS